MAKHRTHSIEFKRQIAQDFIAGETLHALANRHDISRNLIRNVCYRNGCRDPPNLPRNWQETGIRPAHRQAAPALAR